LTNAAFMLPDSLMDPDFAFDGAVELQAARPAALIAPLSSAFDLAESQSPGHGVRVAHVALAVAETLGLKNADRRTVFYASLLHDSGVAVAELPPEVDPNGGHAAAGGWVAARLGLDERIQNTILASHERWDGAGRPQGTAGGEIPLEALIVNAAHWAIEIAENPESPLKARASLLRVHPRDIAPMVGSEVAEATTDALHGDSMWTGLWDNDLAALLAGGVSGDGRASVKNVERIAAALGDVTDASVREAGRSARVADLAMQLARRMGIAKSERRAIGVAGRLLDIGQMGIPRFITEKPSILSLEEMELMRHHPGMAARILEATPGMDEISMWVSAHHERPDGRGYPEMLQGYEIPLAARILAVADSYWALRADRPHREAFSHAEAREILEAGADEHYDADVVMMLETSLGAAAEAAG